MGYPRITPEQIESYRHLYYDLGWTMQEIADFIGKHSSTVQEAMQRNGLSPEGQHQGRVRNYRGTPITGCWLWIGWVDKNGYGKGSWEGKNILVHRGAYEAFYGPIPKGMNVCHHCDTPACYRPDHLFLGTQKDNMTDMTAKGRRAGNIKYTKEELQRIIDCDTSHNDGSLTKLCKEIGISITYACDVRRRFR